MSSHCARARDRQGFFEYYFFLANDIEGDFGQTILDRTIEIAQMEIGQ